MLCSVITYRILAVALLLLWPVLAWAQTEKPELVLQTGHTYRVSCAVFSPDGVWLASGGNDNVVKIWDLATGRELRTLRGHTNYVNAVALSRDGQVLASGGNERSVKLWNTKTGAELRTLTGHAKPVNSLAFSPDGRWLASGGNDNAIKIWDATTGQNIATLAGHVAGVTALTFSADGKMLASGDFAGALKLWDTAAWKETNAPAPHAKKVTSIAFSADGKWLISGSIDGTAKLWQPQPKREQKSGETTGAPVLNVRFNANGSFVTARADGTVTTRNPATGAAEATAKVKPPDDAPTPTLDLLVLSQDAQRAAISIGDRNITLRTLAQPDAAQQLASRSNVFFGIAFSPDGRWFASGTNDRSVRLWDVKTGREVAKLSGHRGFVQTVAFSPGGGFVAAGSLSGAVKIWDLENGNREMFAGQRLAHDDGVNSVAFSPDAKLLASASADQTVKLWNLADGTLARTLTGHTGEVLGVAFSSDGKWLASSSADQTVRLWDATKWDAPPRVVLQNEGNVYGVAFSPDAKMLAAAADKSVKLWRAPFASPAQSFPQTATSYSVSFSYDNKTLAATGRDRVVHLYDTTAGNEKRQLTGHTAPVNGVAYSPDPRWLVSAAEDGSMIVWDAEQGTAAATLVSGYENDDWLVITPDGLFDGSPNAWQQILWRFKGDTFRVSPVELFFNDYFAPGVLADIFGNKNPKAALNLAQRDRRLPVLKLAQMPDTHMSDPRFVRLKVNVAEAAPNAERANGSGVTDLRLFRNGVLVKIWRGDVLQGQSSKAVEVAVPLVAGPNLFTAYAFNRDNVKCVDSALTVNGPETLRRKGVAHILAIGINQYANPGYNLKLAGADAQSVIAAVAKAQEKLDQFERFEVTPLLDQDATKANILAALRRLADPTAPLPPNAPPALMKMQPAQPADVVVIFYAGHGLASKDRWYMLPHDLGYTGSPKNVDEKALATVLQHSISDLELETAIEGIDARGILMILDACNSGQALESEEKRRGPMNSRGLAQLAYEKGMFLLAASESFQYALESKKLGHGYLTYTLVEEGLSGLADTSPKDGVTLAQEWLRFAARRVPQLQLEREVTQNGAKPAPPPTLAREFGLGGPQKPPPPAKKLPRVEDVQRPRLFYRQELDKAKLIVARS